MICSCLNLHELARGLQTELLQCKGSFMHSLLGTCGGHEAGMCHWSWCFSLLGKTKHIKAFQRSYVLANMFWWLISDTCDQDRWDLLVILLSSTLRGGDSGQFSEQSFEQDFNMSFQCCSSHKLIFQCWYTLCLAQFLCQRDNALSVHL